MPWVSHYTLALGPLLWGPCCGASVMAVAADGPTDCRPSSAHAAHNAASMTAHCAARRGLARAQNDSRQAARGDMLDMAFPGAAFALVRVEQRYLLMTVHGVDKIVDIKRHRIRRRRMPCAIRIHQRAGRGHDLAQYRCILRSRNPCLGTEIAAAAGHASAGLLECRISGQRIALVAVLGAASDRQNPPTQDRGEAVRRARGIARISAARRSIMPWR